ncbi:MAG: Holliday junction branch migration protein RuvA [Anaerolineae bacterium]
MIARLEGTVLSVEEHTLVVNVGGVGFAVGVPDAEVYQIGHKVVLHTHLHVRENELALYGFESGESRTLFELLLGVNRVGPKVALSIMSTLTPDKLRQAIAGRQPEMLARASGVGRKTAEAIILHLKDKIDALAGPAPVMDVDEADVIAALTALGFSVVEAQRALQQVPQGEGLSVEEKIRRALTHLGPHPASRP